ncbi:MAG: RNA methyltransferase [Prevotellaceae bacterium]|nr:RNA methyltransferase [Prevotellaceae bacterium]
MISKNLIKYIHSLEAKKNRIKEGLFVAEGVKVVADLMAIMKPKRIVATEVWFDENNIIPSELDAVVTEEELRKVSFLQHPQQVLALFDIPSHEVSPELCAKELCLALDTVQDPGNLGTIIRIADWFGISTIFCSNDTADAFNPKVIQATMGSIARVNIVYTELAELIDRLPKGTPVYGTSLEGENIYAKTLSSSGLIIMGNEGKGISERIMNKVNQKLLIPCYQQQSGIDSLNVAVATAVTCAEFRRQSRMT